jgi:hypothetical protein
MPHPTHLGGSGPGPSVVMTSVIAGWKDIGLYLGKGTRTVQRWERDLGLPVRRTHEGPKPGVLAVRAEIDAWVQARRLHGGRIITSRKLERERLLLQSLKELRSENQELRRLLEAERAKREAAERSLLRADDPFPETRPGAGRSVP